MIRRLLLSTLLATGLPATAPASADPVVHAPAARLAEPVHGRTETAVLAGGCFWGVQGVFAHVKGVVSTTAGYAGGQAATANYETVSTGATGHAEAVRIVFDPRRVNYADLLRIYFSVVTDPTTLDAQGPDRGSQYRSAIFPQSAAQAMVARAYLRQLGAARLWARPIVTRIEPAAGFYPAEAHHQQFLARNPTYPYIVVNDLPKVAALQHDLPQFWRG